MLTRKYIGKFLLYAGVILIFFGSDMVRFPWGSELWSDQESLGLISFNDWKAGVCMVFSGFLLVVFSFKIQNK